MTDGIDLVQEAAAALLEQAAEHAAGENWLDTPYIVRRLSRRVYVRLDDSAAYQDDTTTPIQEVYKAVRRAVQASRAVQIDPRNGYLYLEDLTPDGVDTIYHRLGKYADLGGYETGGHLPRPGETVNGRAIGGNYTVDRQAAIDCAEIMEQLRLTDRQATIVRLRMQGKGYKQIATYLGVDEAGIKVQMRRLRAKCEKIGFTPSMWKEMTAEETAE